MKTFDEIFRTYDIEKIEINNSKIFNQGTSEAVYTAEFLFKEISKNNRVYLKPSFIYALASIIEGDLNCIIINFCFDRFGDNYKRIAKSYLKMTIHDKLNIIIPMISDYKFDLNHNKEEMKLIRKIIDIRNQFIHIKSHYKKTIWFETKQGQHYMKEVDKNELGVYDQYKYQQIDMSLLKKLYRAQKKFTPRFHDLSSRIKRKNFNPHDWFHLIKNDKENIVIKVK